VQRLAKFQYDQDTANDDDDDAFHKPAFIGMPFFFQIISTIVYPVIYYGYFMYYLSTHQEEIETEQFPIRSWSDFLPRQLTGQVCLLRSYWKILENIGKYWKIFKSAMV
jgi:hypothetical protein